MKRHFTESSYHINHPGAAETGLSGDGMDYRKDGHPYCQGTPRDDKSGLPLQGLGGGLLLDPRTGVCTQSPRESAVCCCPLQKLD